LSIKEMGKLIAFLVVVLSIVSYVFYIDLVNQIGRAAEPPYVLANGVLLHVEDNKNYEAKETIVFSHGFLWSTELWKNQVSSLNNSYRIINYDHRGQGKSEVPRGDATITMEQVYEDAVALLDNLKLGPVHFVGLSMGGFVGMRIAARRPDLLKTVTLASTSAEKDLMQLDWKNKFLMLLLPYIFPNSLAIKEVLPASHGKEFLSNQTNYDYALQYAMHTMHRNYYRCARGIFDRDQFRELSKIEVPTLIVHGEEDMGIPISEARKLHAEIKGSKFVAIPGSSHHIPIEKPDFFSEVLTEFLGANQ